MFLPLGLNLAKRKILIIGGGAAAAQKIKTLALYKAELTVLAPEIKIKNPKVKKRIKHYAPTDLPGYDLIYACTNDRRLNRQIASAARRWNILVNVCDDPQNSDFISPAVFKRGRMSAAVFSDGRDVRASLRWRDKIKKIFSKGKL